MAVMWCLKQHISDSVAILLGSAHANCLKTWCYSSE